jgi:hypothetical protein
MKGSLRHSNGIPVSLDADWVKEARKGYFLLLKSKYNQLCDLEGTRNRIRGNLKTVRELINHAAKINKLYMISHQQVQLLSDELLNRITEDLQEFHN